MPVYNERATIEEILKRVQAVELPKELIVVDDGSVDGTREILNQYNNNGVKVVFQDRNRGKGAAIRAGLAHATGDVVVIQDADLEYDPHDFKALIQPIREGRAEVVYGHRRLNKENPISAWRFYLGARFLTLLTNVLYRARISDEAACYKMFRTDVLKSLGLRCNRFEFCPEVTAKVRKRGIEIHEVPISYNPRKVYEGKKIGWRDGLQAIWTLIKYRFVG
jgi:glycosyltransferase involved in cell wall biosynthesis